MTEKSLYAQYTSFYTYVPRLPQLETHALVYYV